jgi:thymidylate synthase (FAD)
LKIIKPSFEILTSLEKEDILRIYKNIERAGRISWKSEDKITDNSYEKFIPMIISKNHESVLEHESLSVKFIFDRGVSHEIVRHRLASFTQESTRYCNYTNDKFDGNITFIDICDHLKNSERSFDLWLSHMANCEATYNALIEAGESPQIARSVLPNSLKTEIIITANIREWRHILLLRAARDAHPQMREVMYPLLLKLKEKLPILFGDINRESNISFLA